MRIVSRVLRGPNYSGDLQFEHWADLTTQPISLKG